MLYNNVKEIGLDEAKQLNSKHSCNQCKYSKLELNYKCISPQLISYYEENNCPYFSEIKNESK